jgi:hypothetical protein
VSDRREALSTELRAHLEVILQLRAQLDDNHRLIQDALSMIEDGALMTEIFAQIPLAEGIAATDGAVSELFESRHRVRRLVIGLALNDGMSVEQLASTFGVTPDRVRSSALGQIP